MKFEASDFPAEVIDAIAAAVAQRVAEQMVPRQSGDEIFDTKEAASYLKLSKQQLEIWRCRGGGPTFSKLSRRVRYRRSDLDTWLNKSQQRNTSEGGKP